MCGIGTLISSGSGKPEGWVSLIPASTLFQLSLAFPSGIRLVDAEVQVPSNCQSPIAAKLQMALGARPIVAEFDWRQKGTQTWDIDIQTTGGHLKLSQGGASMSIDGQLVNVAKKGRIFSSLSSLRRAHPIERDGRGSNPLEAGGRRVPARPTN
jgi:hypothetical protein